MERASKVDGIFPFFSQMNIYEFNEKNSSRKIITLKLKSKLESIVLMSASGHTLFGCPLFMRHSLADRIQCSKELIAWSLETSFILLFYGECYISPTVCDVIIICAEFNDNNCSYRTCCCPTFIVTCKLNTWQNINSIRHKRKQIFAVWGYY